MINQSKSLPGFRVVTSLDCISDIFSGVGHVLGTWARSEKRLRVQANNLYCCRESVLHIRPYSSNNKGNALMIDCSYLGSSPFSTGVSSSSLNCSAFLTSFWTRSCWFSWDSVLPLVLDFVFVFVAWHLSSDCSGVSRSSLAHFCSRRLWKWSGLFLQSEDFCHDVHGVTVFRSLVFCITVKSCWVFSRWS